MKQAPILILCLAALLCGCQTSTSEVDSAIDTGAWQCRDAPDIHIRLIDYTDEFAFCEISAGLEVGSGSMSVIQFSNMVNDGHWDRIPMGGPMLLPPPPNWGDQPQKKGTGIRIDGSTNVVFYIYTPLPVHDQITITEAIPSSE